MEFQKNPVDLSRNITTDDFPALPDKSSVVIYLLHVLVCCFVFYTFSPYQEIHQCKNLIDMLLFCGSIFCAVYLGILDVVLYRRHTFGKFLTLSTSAILADIVIIVVEGSMLPGSHSMAPFELIAVAFFSFVIFLFLFLISKISTYIIGD